MPLDAPDTAHAPRRIIGLGASAGGLEALRIVVPQLPAWPGVTYVVLQHLSPAHRSMLVEILSPLCPLPLRELTDGMPPLPGHVLMTPANAHVRFDDGRFHLLEANAHVLPRPSINLFFESLASSLGPRGGGIILSGTGTDGAEGLRSLARAGGLVMVQHPRTARYTGMPDAAVQAVGPGHEVEPSGIGEALRDALAHGPGAPGPEAAAPHPAPEGDDPTPPEDGTDPAPGQGSPRQELFRRLRLRCGLDLENYKDGTVQRRLLKRRQAVGAPDLAAYVAHVDAHPEELDALATDMLIGVTAFWRDPEAYDALLKELLAEPPAKGPVRAWVAGCSSGEEAYSIAIALSEAMDRQAQPRALQVFATDLSDQALVSARRGVFPQEALTPLGEDRITRYFFPSRGGMEVRALLRERIVFSRHDLTRDPPFPRMDLVTCRNVLIYLRPAAQARALSLFAYALRPGGLLLLGRSETTTGPGQHFDAVDKVQRLYRRNGSVHAPAPNLAVVNDGVTGGAWVPAGPTVAPPPPRPRHRGTEERLLALVSRHELPGALLLDGMGRVLHVHGEVGPVFGLNPGQQRLDLMALVRPEFAAELRLLTAPELAPGERRVAALQSGQGRARRRWLLSLARSDDGGEQLAVLRPLGRLEGQGLSIGVPGASAEMDEARRRLRELVEQLEASNEEMQALNEEAQATNEELQSSNEELESSNEELQATNQELATVNAELNHQWHVYRRLAEELESVLQSITMPLLVLSDDLSIQRFNAAAAEMFRLDPGSVGRHFDTMHRPAGLPDLVSRLRAFGDSASPSIETLPMLADGRHLSLHLSHRVQERQRNGLVVTFSDHTAIAAAERAVLSLEQRVLSLLEHGRGLIAIKDTQGRYEYVNARCAEFLGVPREALTGHTDAQALPPALARLLRDRDLEALRATEGTEHEEVLETPDGRRVWWANRFVLRDAEGTPTAVCLQAIDTTRAHSDDEQRRISARVLEVTGEGVMITNEKLQILRVNRAFTTITGYSEAEVLGRTPGVLRSDRHDAEFYARLWSEVNRVGSWQGEVWNRNREGVVYPEWLSISAMRDDTGQVTHYVGVFSDISALVDSRQRLEQMATQDVLTGLPNRRMLTDRLQQAISRASRQGGEIALCFIDLDNFKTVNDSLGHEAGDDLLKEIARRLHDNLRSADTVARLGGDEFVLLLEGSSRHECLQTVERIHRALAGTIKVRGHEVPCGVSVGIAMYPEDGEDGNVLMQHADAAMYRAKEGGKGRYEFFSREAADDARHRLRIEVGLREAITRRQFRLAYQPQWSLDDGELLGVEALLRWQPEPGRTLSPSVFLQIAEESSLIEDIGRWVLGEALRQMAAWRDQGAPPFTISVNVSARQLRDRAFVESVRQALYDHGIPGRQLVLEITETALLATGRDLDALMSRLRSLDVQVSLDDFGTGYSSLARLRQLYLQELKIDREFIAGLADDRSDREIVAAVLGMAKALDMRVVAEGVETDAQRQLLRDMAPGIVGQGFLLGRPAPGERRPWLKDETLLKET